MDPAVSTAISCVCLQLELTNKYGESHGCRQPIALDAYDVQHLSDANDFIYQAPIGVYGSNNRGIVFDRPFMHEALVASLVANGMSHAVEPDTVWKWSSYHQKWYTINITVFPSENIWSNSLPGVVLRVKSSISVYAYTFDGIWIKISILVLFVYCVYTLSYVVFTFVTGKSARTWCVVLEMMALAMNLTPGSVLQNTSAGIEQVDTFRKTVSVREVKKHQRLELVFDDDMEKVDAYNDVHINRAY
jgi:hypothetical protein